MGQLTIPARDGSSISVSCETGQVSDGYHTFDELYDHRCLLFLAFQSLLFQTTGFSDKYAWKSKNHWTDGKVEPVWDGWFVVGVEVSETQITYHIPMKYWSLASVPEVDSGPEYDGHTSADVIERLKTWLS